MLLRAAFWITVVAVLMPREPDLGLGRPNATGSFVQSVQSEAQSANCDNYRQTCTVALNAVDTFQSLAVRGLAQVKADIEREERAAHRRAD